MSTNTINLDSETYKRMKEHLEKRPGGGTIARFTADAINQLIDAEVAGPRIVITRAQEREA